jgi:tRNA G18 (ribose-2'-O)-methylase SpoU
MLSSGRRVTTTADRHEVTEREDPAIAAFVDLREPVVRNDLGCFIAEGHDIVSLAMSQGMEIVSALIDGRSETPPYLPSSCRVLAAAPKLIGEITRLGVLRGVLALVRRPVERSVDEVLGAARRVVILEGVQNPVNVGLIARSAAGLGFDGLLIDPTCADPLYRRAVTASRGATLHLPWARVEHSSKTVRARGFVTVGLTPDPCAVDLRTVDLRATPRVALVVGTEGEGLTDATLGAADLLVRIPMQRGVDSLNVATATAIVCWHLAAGS